MKAKQKMAEMLSPQQVGTQPQSRHRTFVHIIMMGLIVMALWISDVDAVFAAFVPPPSTQFDINGFLQSATLTTPADPLSGGTLMVNDQVVTVPANTIVILPANALTWQELFSQAPAPYTGAQTGMALADSPTPFYTYEVHVVGNRVGDTYIAGLIDIAQNGLNSGAGYINFIDYTTGEFRVGGTIGSSSTGTRVRLNDPLGRYGRVMTPDQRFSVDPDNPTISSATGFPMCFPRVPLDPNATDGAGNFLNPDDPLCPRTNRIANPDGTFALSQTMTDPASLPNGGALDPRIQASMEIGDYVTFAGTLINDTAGSYVSAHTVTNNAGIYTAPGTNPAYVLTDVGLIGTGGLTVIGAGEAAVRTRFEGMSTDPSRNIHLYGIDLDPATGAISDRDWGTIGVDPGPPNGAVKGRWRFRPPCLPFGTVPTKPDKQCVMNAAGTFLPPTREVRAVIEGQQSQVTALAANDQTKTSANGLFYGQYHAPILEYIFPENIPGSPIVENNFNAIDFLALGGYTSSAGTKAGVLSPWPSNIAPSTACVPPTANAGGPYTVASGGTVTLAGSATGTPPLTYAWATPASGTLSDTAIAAPVYTAQTVIANTTDNLSLTVTNACGTNTASTSITINAPAAPTVNQVAPISLASGANGGFTVSGSDPNNTTPLTFTVSQSGTPTLTNFITTQNPPTGAAVTFTAPVLPVGQVDPTVIQISITATNSAGTVSASESNTVTVKPIADSDTISTAQYRTSKQRLDITATSSVVSPNVALTLQPYQTESGTTFTPPAATLTNNGNGNYTMTLVGAPPPACKLGGTYATPCSQKPLVVKSNVGGTSPATALTNIRQ